MTGSIDIVCNLFTPQEVRNNQTGLDETFKLQVRMPDAMCNGVEIEDYLAKMDRSGIDCSLLIAVRCGDLAIRGSFEIPYARVAEVCAAHPDRFSGLAGVDPFRGMQGLRDLEAAVTQHGFVGAHLYPHWFGLAPDDAKDYPYYAKCCELAIPMMMQVGQNLIYSRDRRLPSVGHPMCLDKVAIDFPELKLLGIHIGVPWTDEMIAMAWKHENVFIGVDAYAPKHWPPRRRLQLPPRCRVLRRHVRDPAGLRAGGHVARAQPERRDRHLHGAYAVQGDLRAGEAAAG